MDGRESVSRVVGEEERRYIRDARKGREESRSTHGPLLYRSFSQLSHHLRKMPDL